MITLPPDFNLISFVQAGGPYCAVLELLAIGFLLRDRARLLQSLKAKEQEVRDLAERVITLAAEIKTFLFSERRA